MTKLIVKSVILTLQNNALSAKLNTIWNRLHLHVKLAIHLIPTQNPVDKISLLPVKMGFSLQMDKPVINVPLITLVNYVLLHHFALNVLMDTF